ncbi:MAG TPA: MaoC family dehydratase N-terminal domain-containing protein [Afipia sp.]
MTDPVDIDYLRQWIGRTHETSDVVTAHLAKALRATLFQEPGDPRPGDAAPLTSHWCLAQPVVTMDELGADGHPSRGGFLPPVPLPRRMWAGGSIEFHDSLRVGDEISRWSKITDVSLKSGSTGPLCFVSVEHTIRTSRGIAIREMQNVAYRDATTSPTKKPASPPELPLSEHSHKLLADPVLLFRYSALTFNGHRIHYDRDYVTKIEGYPGLIVHGPLQASLLIEFAYRLNDGQMPRAFSYRGMQPLFDGAEFSLNAAKEADGLSLWVANGEGVPTMKASVSW